MPTTLLQTSNIHKICGLGGWPQFYVFYLVFYKIKNSWKFKAPTFPKCPDSLCVSNSKPLVHKLNRQLRVTNSFLRCGGWGNRVKTSNKTKIWLDSNLRVGGDKLWSNPWRKTYCNEALGQRDMNVSFSAIPILKVTEQGNSIRE